jgi:hypothetical protein
MYTADERLVAAESATAIVLLLADYKYPSAYAV